ncbi:MAG: FAD-dependent oxidoreductase [Chromatiales bacterium]|jgi:3-phenylpropionate/trans-cinnamate dioxygenase ferredoxin reductase subunit|nr:FAD-dependent oxidoreductase [Chromatiales bacterium]
MSERVVIAGAGHAAGQTIVSLRQAGFAGSVTLVGEEPYLPYQRPPLSKKFLAGELDVARLLLRQERFYADHGVDVRLNLRVTGVDRGPRHVRLSDGERLPYDHLVLATGSRVRRVPIPGSELNGVHYLRTIEDVDRIRDHVRAGASAVIVGAGYIGLEVAAVLRQLDLAVTVVELAPGILARIEAPPVAAFYTRMHEEAGVHIRCGTGVAKIHGENRVTGVTLTDGTDLPADLVIIGVGIVPATELAETAGLPCDNGIVVDEFCRTADPHILAIGDCTNHPNPLLGRRLRLESVHNAQEQAKTAAAAILGTAQPYAQIPWFWSDQYDLKLQIVGFSARHEQAVVRGDPASRSFAVFFLDEGRLTSCYAINSPREFMLSKKLVAARACPDPAALADTARPFKEIADALVGDGGGD